MISKDVLGFMLATSFALTTLAGCNVPNAALPVGAQQNGGQTNNEGRPQTGAPAPGAARDGAAEALAEEREMGDWDAVAWDDAAAAYAVSMVGQPEPRAGEFAITAEGEAKAGAGDHKWSEHAFKGKLKAEAHVHLKERMHKRATKAHERLKGHSHKVSDAAKGALWKDNGDGTETRKFLADVSKEVKGKALARKVEIAHRRHIDTKHLIESHIKLETKLPNGASRTSERIKTLKGEDAVFASSYSSALTLKSGAARAVAWDQVVAADGSVTGKGTIAWKRPSMAVNSAAVSVVMKGTEEAAKVTVDSDAVGSDAVDSDTVDADAPEADDEGTDATDDAWGSESDSDQDDN